MELVTHCVAATKVCQRTDTNSVAAILSHSQSREVVLADCSVQLVDGIEQQTVDTQQVKVCTLPSCFGLVVGSLSRMFSENLQTDVAAFLS